MPKYYSPEGNAEIWANKPTGYYSEEEWEKMHPGPEPTKEEQLAELDAQYASDKDELAKYYLDAVLSDNEDLQADLKAELADLNDEYVEARKAIKEG